MFEPMKKIRESIFYIGKMGPVNMWGASSGAIQAPPI
jgi:hypothetical protein